MNNQPPPNCHSSKGEPLIDLSQVDLSQVPYAVLRSEIGRRNQRRRKTVSRAGGRPKSPRCACGAHTEALAARLGHVCPPQHLDTN